MLKRYRQEQILKLVRARAIHTQEELAAGLERLGVPSTQVTLSRDIHELSLVKTAEGYKEIARLATPSAPALAGPRPADPRQLRRIAGEVLRDVRQAQNLLVLKTDPAGAQPLALALDQENWPDVVGTIAGDDTVLVVSPTDKAATAARAKLLALIGR
jgi:transcriptional regulator of arginine metabolism